jgi:hypothetical protein
MFCVDRELPRKGRQEIVALLRLILSFFNRIDRCSWREDFAIGRPLINILFMFKPGNLSTILNSYFSGLHHILVE